MNKYLIICNIFFISVIRGKMIPPVTTATKTTLPVLIPLLSTNENNTQKVLSEAGSIVHTNAATLPSVDMALINLEKNVSVSGETSAVVARKGVNFADDIKSHEETSVSDVPFLKASNTTKTPVPDIIKIHKGKTILNGTKMPNDVQKVNGTKHKPLILSSEALAKMDKINNVTLEDNSPSIKAHVVKAGSHPGMILPIVITILVVPMFAVVAYLALKRGQEAWKNRHYKRMDFLLDGMYND